MGHQIHLSAVECYLKEVCSLKVKQIKSRDRHKILRGKGRGLRISVQVYNRIDPLSASDLDRSVSIEIREAKGIRVVVSSSGFHGSGIEWLRTHKINGLKIGAKIEAWSWGRLDALSRERAKLRFIKQHLKEEREDLVGVDIKREGDFYHVWDRRRGLDYILDPSDPRLSVAYQMYNEQEFYERFVCEAMRERGIRKKWSLHFKIMERLKSYQASCESKRGSVVEKVNYDPVSTSLSSFLPFGVPSDPPNG